jgi:hypothetical protein
VPSVNKPFDDRFSSHNNKINEGYIGEEKTYITPSTYRTSVHSKRVLTTFVPRQHSLDPIASTQNLGFIPD